jgi:uncharacterized membrane protein YbhN (UPF0104 family)
MGSGWKARVTWIALALGVMLLVAAIMKAVGQVDWAQLSEAQPWQVGLLAGAVLVNLFVSGVLWWVLALSFDAKPRVGFGRMLALVCASSLLNYLPLRPGLVGRAAFLKMRHNLSLRQSAWMVVIVLGLSAIVLGGAAAIVSYVPPAVQYESALMAGVILTVAVPVIAGRLLKRRIVVGWLWVPVRAADVLVTAVRLWVAFQIVGKPIAYEEAVLLASAGLFVSLLGITPNGLGLREWAIAGVATGEAEKVAFAAAVIDRGIEAVVITITGLWAMQRVSFDGKGGSDEGKKGGTGK